MRKNYVPEFDVVEALHGEAIGLRVLPDEALASHEAQGTNSRALLGPLLQPHAETRAGALVHCHAVLVVAVRDRQSDARVSLQGVEERVGDPPSHRPRRFIQPETLDTPPTARSNPSPRSVPPPSLAHPINPASASLPACLPPRLANRRYTSRKSQMLTTHATQILANHER